MQAFIHAHINAQIDIRIKGTHKNIPRKQIQIDISSILIHILRYTYFYTDTFTYTHIIDY